MAKNLLMADNLTPNTVADHYWNFLNNRDTLNAEYRETLEALDAEHRAKRRALYTAHTEEQVALQADYRARLALKPLALKPLSQ